MSFDLGIWYSDHAMSADEAREFFSGLCGDAFQTADWVGKPDRPEIVAFMKELTDIFPESDKFDDDSIDDCVWSNSIDWGPYFALLNISSSRTDVAPKVVELAKKHGLICYDPQSNDVYLPNHLKPTWRKLLGL